MPDASPIEGTPGHGATEWFLAMGGWMVLHEIGHVVNRHFEQAITTVEDHRRIEFEADAWASAWILNDYQAFSGDDERVFAKRSIGAAMALSVLASWEVYDRTEGWPTHPDPPVRLLQFLETFVPDSGQEVAPTREAAWYVAMLVLQLHLVNAGKIVERPGGYPNVAQYIKDAIKALGNA
jgi:hypothetical protein